MLLMDGREYVKTGFAVHNYLFIFLLLRQLYLLPLFSIMSFLEFRKIKYTPKVKNGDNSTNIRN